VVGFVASIVQYLERSFFIISYVRLTCVLNKLMMMMMTSASDLLVRTIRFSSVVFGVMSSLAVIHTIHGRL